MNLHQDVDIASNAAAEALSSIDASVIEVPTIITCTIEGLIEVSDLGNLFGLGEIAPAAAQGEAVEGQAPLAPTCTPDEQFDIMRLRERHHSVARLIASGMQQSIVAEISRYTESYLSILLKAPAMQELIGHYKSHHATAAAITTERMLTLGMSASDELQRRINDNPESVETTELISVAKLGLDRGGHGPSATKHVVNETHLIDHAELKRLNAAARASDDDFIDASNHAKLIIDAPQETPDETP